MPIDQEPKTGFFNFLASTLLALFIIAVGFSEGSGESYESWLMDVGSETPAPTATQEELVFNKPQAIESSASTPAKAQSQYDQSGAVKNKVETYYEKTIAGDQYGAYEGFRTNAVLKYSIEIMGEKTEFTLTLDSEYDDYEAIFEGYEIVSSSYEIQNVSMDALEVEATFKQKYRWEGYEGTMTANEVFKFERAGGQFYVVSLSSTQKY